MNYFKANIKDYKSILFPTTVNTKAAQYAVLESNQMLLWEGKSRTPSHPYCNISFYDDYAIKELNFAHFYHIFYQLYLSKPTSTLSSLIMGNRQQLAGKYVVGMHIHLGGTKLGDPNRHSLRVIPEMAKVAKELCSLHHANTYNNTTSGSGFKCALFVVSDSIDAVEKVEQEVKGSNIVVVSPDGNVYHIDHSKQYSEQSAVADNMKMFADWLLLGSSSDALIISR